MARVYVGNLPEDIRQDEVERMFGKFGRIADIAVKMPRQGGPAFAFLQFDNPRDAEDAVRAKDGEEFDRRRLRVEFARGGRNSLDRGDRGDRGPRGFGGPPAGGFGGPRGPPTHGDFRCRITGCPRGTSWQDLKDFCRQVCEVGRADMIGEDVGVVEFRSQQDMDETIRRLDNTELISRFDERKPVRMEPDMPGGAPPPRPSRYEDRRGGGRYEERRDGGRRDYDDRRHEGRRDRDDDDEGRGRGVDRDERPHEDEDRDRDGPAGGDAREEPRDAPQDDGAQNDAPPAEAEAEAEVGQDAPEGETDGAVDVAANDDADNNGDGDADAADNGGAED